MASSSRGTESERLVYLITYSCTDATKFLTRESFPHFEISTASFAWVGVEDAEIIFLNDFRRNPVIIAWADFLRAMEGDTGYFPAPKTFCKQDMELANDTPFLETADAPLVPVKGTSIDRANPNMMDVRWCMFHFWHQIPQAEQPNLISYGHCFAKFILDRTTGS